MPDNKLDILFELPVKLKQDIELKEFKNNGTEVQYLIISDNRHYVVNLFTYNLLLAIKKGGNLEEIRKNFSIVQNNDFHVNEIILAINEVLVPKGIVETNIEVDNPRASSFLYLKIPIISKKILKPITSCLQYLFAPKIAFSVIIAILFAHLFIFIGFHNMGTLKTIMLEPTSFGQSVLLVIASMMFHEFGHSSACRFFGAKYEEIGFGIYLRFPVFYSNISDAWRLSSKKRAIVDIAGIYFQFVFNIFLIVMFLITKNEVFFIVVKLVLIQTLFSLNPFFRYDGYWLATDLLGIPNLRKKSVGILKYIFQKHILRKKTATKIEINVNPISKVFFTFYAVVSNIFLMGFVIVLFIMLPSIIKNIPTMYFDIVSIIQNNENGIVEIITSVYQMLFKFFYVGLSLFFAYKILKAAFKLIININYKSIY